MCSSKHDVEIKWDQKIPMRDGVELSADIYLPKVNEKVPAIVVRTPYGKNTGDTIKIGRYFSEHGYAVVYNDVRGRGDSDGKFEPYFNEGTDGFDVVEWTAQQEWCDGNIGTRGGSYLARIQWYTALEQPPHLKAMISTVSPSDPFVENPSGLEDPMHLSWHFLVSGRVVQNVDNTQWEKVYRHLPVSAMDEGTGRKIKPWRDAMDHVGFSKYWQPLYYQTRFNEIDLPVLHVSGWYDDEQIGTPLNFSGMKGSAKTSEARESQKLIMGPWPHAVNKSQKIGDMDFGPDSTIDLMGIEKRWFDRWLRGELNGIEKEPSVSIFVMGANRWRQENEWPLKRTRMTPYYFSSNGKANSRFGDGKLAIEEPIEKSVPDRYDYDPRDPVPFITDQTSSQIGGPDNYSSVERRDDVLVYSTDEFERETEITGPVSAKLYVSTSALDTDFMVKILDVWPNGYAQRLSDGMIRARFRNGMDHQDLLEPDATYELQVNMWYTSQVILPHHWVRIEVSSSAFPKYSRNLNNGEDLAKSSRIVVAHQTLYHDRARPSHVLLPIIPRGAD